ncbi:TetR/AcrR family transcriptional regulator [Embleya sp. NBC_00896]|uniref:TetR/AcrR family transcriptional regulator n=1 Tax=Embleya sp. NBC_00896 TaxID=2975961 RepID=UPI0038683AD9|nr:TetR/AcrR family transcriptional regulator [Embleya sp. NBC_00896]
MSDSNEASRGGAADGEPAHDPAAQGATTPKPRRGWAGKHAAILAGARVVFAREGYAGAGIDAIAAEAGASTRTIYNHFQDKETLFGAVVQDSSVQVRDRLIEVTRRHLDRVTDLEADLLALARAWVDVTAEFPEHFALVRQLDSAAGHFPEELIDAWRAVGPDAAQAELARHMALLIAQGRLAEGDPQRMARFFHVLTFAELNERSARGATPLDDAEVTVILTAGIRAFLYGQAVGPAGRPGS